MPYKLLFYCPYVDFGLKWSTGVAFFSAINLVFEFYLINSVCNDLKSLCPLTIKHYDFLWFNRIFLIEQFNRFYSVLSLVFWREVYSNHLSRDFLCNIWAFLIIYHFMKSIIFCLLSLLTLYGKYTPVTSLGLSSWGALWPEEQ